jgi:hypothetical protein
MSKLLPCGGQALDRNPKDGPQARRLLALAAIYDEATRTEAAKIGGVGLQIIRNWVLHFCQPAIRGSGTSAYQGNAKTGAISWFRYCRAIMINSQRDSETIQAEPWSLC